MLLYVHRDHKDYEGRVVAGGGGGGGGGGEGDGAQDGHLDLHTVSEL